MLDIFTRHIFLSSTDLSKALAKIGALTTSVNAVIAVIFASVIYLILRPVLKKSGMLREM